jgi:hypothetical protein
MKSFHGLVCTATSALKGNCKRQSVCCSGPNSCTDTTGTQISLSITIENINLL